MLATKILSKYLHTPLERLFLVLLAFVFFFFSYYDFGVFYDNSLVYLKNILGFFHIRFYLFWGLSVVFLSGLIFYFSKKESGRFILKIVMGVAAAIPLLQGGWVLYTNKMPPYVMAADLPQNIQFKIKPNVYFILLDAYGRADVLKKELNFDNTPFLSALREQGFFVQENSFSNYHFTLGSLSATFAMTYHKPDAQGRFHSQEFYRAWRGPHTVGEIFKENGYKIVFAAPGVWGEIKRSGYEDWSVSEYSQNNEILTNILACTPFLKWVHFDFDYMTFQDIGNPLDIFPGEPKFFYIHSALVHDSIYTLEDGRLKQNPTYCGDGSSQSAIDQVKALQEINQSTLSFITEIRSLDPQAIILLCSDHGLVFLNDPNDPTYTRKLTTQREFLKKFGNLTAVFVPECAKNPTSYLPYFNEDTSLVNLFRSLFSYLSGVPIPQLPNASYFVQYDNFKKIYYLENPENLREKFMEEKL